MKLMYQNQTKSLGNVDKGDAISERPSRGSIEDGWSVRLPRSLPESRSLQAERLLRISRNRIETNCKPRSKNSLALLIDYLLTSLSSRA